MLKDICNCFQPHFEKGILLLEILVLWLPVGVALFLVMATLVMVYNAVDKYCEIVDNFLGYGIWMMQEQVHAATKD